MNRTKRYIPWLLVCISFFLIVGYYLRQHTQKKVVKQYQLPIEHALIASDGKPSQELKNLLDFLHVKHDNTLESIVEATGKVWLRTAGKERWQVEDTLKDRKEELTPFFTSLQTVEEINPQQQKYTYAILLGATAFTVRKRFKNLIDCWKNGIRFEKIIMLGADRPLDSQVEPDSAMLLNTTDGFDLKPDWTFNGIYPTTEMEMMRLIVEQVALPKEMESIPFILINSAMKKNEDGSLRRATTGDTIQAWLNTDPEPGSCIVFSNQPYVGYQHVTVKTILPSTFTVETVGRQVGDKERVSTFLDSLARWLYQTKQLRNK